MKAKPIPLQSVKLQDRIWQSRFQLVRDEVIPYQWDALNDRIPGVPPSHAIRNFRIAAGESEGEFKGFVFQDSDLAKWLEAVAYVLAVEPNPELEKTADEVIDLIANAQQPDGYLNTYFTIAEPDKRWTNLRDWHELYCAGHMMEAAVAYYEATGKRKLLEVMCRFADYIAETFGPEPRKLQGYPGHPEIELALVRLYHGTGGEKYLKLSKYFVDQRGQEPHWYDIEAQRRGDVPKYYFSDIGYNYSQAHLPVRQQETAEGHSVRALYLFSGMADVAVETGDEELLEVCRRLWDNVTLRRMYITGGVGSERYGERFTFDYDLPNDRAYTETCASIALVFFAHRMLQADMDAKYANVMERALYNGVLSGISLDGKSFFYVNPLEVWPEAGRVRHDLQHVKTERQGWFACACCPPNAARLLASIGRYMYSAGEDTAYIHLYAASTAELVLAGMKVRLIQETDYPWQEKVTIKVEPEEAREFAIAVRLPDWCEDPSLAVNGKEADLTQATSRGYAYIRRTWQPGDTIELTLPMPVQRISANPKVRENAGRVALQRGPVVYCLEEVDNGPNLSAVILPRDSELSAQWRSDLLGGVVTIHGKALRIDEDRWNGKLYMPAKAPPATREIEITAVPYSTWCNRKPGEMLVWIREA
ncbi:MAG: glycoside hydrolase family 127 protein [Firmicutes bacterium]|nr:glycoside hydrolase family 127 protein [Bacillota bacterium]